MKLIDKTQAVWYSKYQPQVVEDVILPQQLKADLQSYMRDETIPNLGLFSNTPGCLLPGTNITVKAEPTLLRKREIIKKYNISNKEYSNLKRYCSVIKEDQYDYIDDNTITKNILVVIKNIKKGDSVFYNDSLYNDKHLKMNYWLSKLSYADAKKKTKLLRKYKEYFDYDSEYFIQRGYNIINLKENILKLKFRMIYSNFNSIKDLNQYMDKSWNVKFFNKNIIVEGS